MITADQMLELAPGADVPLVDALAPAYALLLPVWQIDTPLRVAHFVAQTCHETAHFTTLVEIGGTRKSYAPYFGRGPIQYTHEDQYAKLGQRLGLPLRAQPERVATAGLGTIAACMYWADHNLNRWADEDDAVAIGRAINRGSATSDLAAYGEQERLALTDRVREIMGIASAVPTQSNRSIPALQRALNRLGASPKLKVDGQAGPYTIEAVRKFQAAHGLVTDGRAGPATWAAIEDAIAEMDA